MRLALSVTGALAAAALFATPSLAQQPAPTPTHTVVRFFKCNPQGAGVQWFQRGRPVVQQMVTEGKFLDYGILAHSWGDEWNVVDYFVVDGLAGFFANFAEMAQRMGQAAPPAAGQPELPPFNEVCTEHKDVIYAVVAPPGG